MQKHFKFVEIDHNGEVREKVLSEQETASLLCGLFEAMHQALSRSDFKEIMLHTTGQGVQMIIPCVESLSTRELLTLEGLYNED